MIHDKIEFAVFIFSAGYLNTFFHLKYRMHIRLLAYLMNKYLQECLIRLCSKIIRFSFSVFVYCDTRLSCIEITSISSKCLCIFQSETVAQEAAAVGFLIFVQNNLIGFFRIKCICLFHPQPKYIAKRTRICPKDAAVCFICNACHIGSNQCSAVFHKFS